MSFSVLLQRQSQTEQSSDTQVIYSELWWKQMATKTNGNLVIYKTWYPNNKSSLSLSTLLKLYHNQSSKLRDDPQPRHTCHVSLPLFLLTAIPPMAILSPRQWTIFKTAPSVLGVCWRPRSLEFPYGTRHNCIHRHHGRTAVVNGIAQLGRFLSHLSTFDFCWLAGEFGRNYKYSTTMMFESASSHKSQTADWGWRWVDAVYRSDFPFILSTGINVSSAFLRCNNKRLHADDRRGDAPKLFD